MEHTLRLNRAAAALQLGHGTSALEDVQAVVARTQPPQPKTLYRLAQVSVAVQPTSVLHLCVVVAFTAVCSLCVIPVRGVGIRCCRRARYCCSLLAPWLLRHPRCAAENPRQGVLI